MAGIAFVWRSTRGCRSRRNAVAPPNWQFPGKNLPQRVRRRREEHPRPSHRRTSHLPRRRFLLFEPPPPRPDWIPPAHVLNSTAFQMALLWSWCAQLITACLTGPSGKPANPRPTTHVPFPTSTRLCHKARGCAQQGATPGSGPIAFPTPKGVVPFWLCSTLRERHGT